MSFAIRTAVPGDVAAITEIYRESVLNGVATYETEPPALEEMRLRFEAVSGAGFPYIVAQAPEGLVLGYAYVSAFRDRAAYRWLVEDSIYLAPEARGKGIGKALLAALIDRSTQAGFRQMVAVIGGAEPASVALHSRAGFQHGGHMPASGFKHGRWLDTIIMQRPLGPGDATPPSPDTFPATPHD
ncbi:GNAT family N-acetyltransferase [Shinella daejeonensis]|uniref:GNAT family N-acetyltransferase n=1 Tax=Shinella daejeonensis TaxID=659017 RepID=UPI0020C7F2FF|nr:GNAT family N-acetyltransferase [Shinella daejeonensis]MCP8896946.1 GNAT family N-acetyltransferase [Shinella daejeonensis]